MASVAATATTNEQTKWKKKNVGFVLIEYNSISRSHVYLIRCRYGTMLRIYQTQCFVCSEPTDSRYTGSTSINATHKTPVFWTTKYTNCIWQKSSVRFFHFFFSSFSTSSSLTVVATAVAVACYSLIFHTYIWLSSLISVSVVDYSVILLFLFRTLRPIDTHSFTHTHIHTHISTKREREEVRSLSTLSNSNLCSHTSLYKTTLKIIISSVYCRFVWAS